MEQSVTLGIGGMTCGGCVASVTRVLQALPGVLEARVSLERGEAEVRFDGARTDVAAMADAVNGAGFEVT